MSKRHVGSKRYGRYTAHYACKADGCEFETDHTLTDRQQREQLREHRRAMGEDVKGRLKIEQSERIKALRAVHDQDLGGMCQYCRTPWPCLHWHILDGDGEAAEKLVEQMPGVEPSDDDVTDPPVCDVCGGPLSRWKSMWNVTTEGKAGPTPATMTYWVWACPRLYCHTMHLEQS